MKTTILQTIIKAVFVKKKHRINKSIDLINRYSIFLSENQFKWSIFKPLPCQLAWWFDTNPCCGIAGYTFSHYSTSLPGVCLWCL